jgi:ADP-glucose pyrophosphorylase
MELVILLFVIRIFHSERVWESVYIYSSHELYSSTFQKLLVWHEDYKRDLKVLYKEVQTKR